MTRDRFRMIVKAAITNNGKILLGKKEEDEDHPIGGEWHFLGGHMDHGEDVEEAVKREVKEETGLEVDVHQIIDVMSISYDKDGESKVVQVLYHCESSTEDAEARDDLEEVKWVDPSDVEEELSGTEAERLKQRPRQQEFIRKLEKMPAF